MKKFQAVVMWMIVVVPITTLFFRGGPVQAATNIWNGGSGTTNGWNTAANWGGTPIASANKLEFQGTTGLTNVNDTTANTTYNGLIFSNNSGALLLTGNSITLSGGITNFSTSVETINLAMSLNNAGQVFSNVSGGQITINGVLSSGSITIAGADGTAVVNLNGVNTFTGGTTISSGTLAITNNNNLGSSGSIFFSTGGSGTLQITNSFTVNRMIAIGNTGNTATGTINIVGSSSVTNNNNIQASSNGGNPTLVKSGSGTFVIANTVDDNGLLLIASNGTVVLNTAISGGHAVSSIVGIANGATVQLNTGTGGSEIYNGGGKILNMNGVLAFNTGTQGVDIFSGAGLVTNMTSSLATLTVNNANTGSSTFSGSIVDGSGSGKMGLVNANNLLVLAGSNTFTGGMTISGGGVAFSNAVNTTFGSVIAGGGTLGMFGSGVMTLTNVNTYTGGTVFNAGTLAVTNDSGLGNSGGALTFNGTGTLQITNSYSFNRGINMNSVAAGNGTISVLGNSMVTSLGHAVSTFTATQTNILYKSGSGTFVVGGSADNGGFTMDVVSGTLVLSNTSGGGSHAVSSIVGVSNGATLQLAGNATDGQIYNGTSGGGGPGGTGVFSMNGVFDFNGRNQSFDNMTGTGVVMNSVAATTSTGTIGTDNGSSTFGGSIQDGPTGGLMALIHTGSGVFTLTGTNTFSGGATISAGQIVLATGLAITNSTITVTANNGLIFSNANAYTIGGLSGAGTISLLNTTGGAVALSVGNNSANTTYSGVMSGSGGSLNKIGNGTTTLSSANTYSGPTIISSGTLLLSGSGAINNSATITVGTTAGAVADFNVSGISSYTLASGQTLKGAGTVTGGLTIGNNSTISPGNSPGTLSLGNTTFSSGGNYVWEINSASTTLGTGKGVDPGYDWENIAGALNITATSGSKFNIDITGLTLSDVQGAVNNWSSANTYSWILATASTGISGFSAGDFNLNTTAFTNNNSVGAGVFSISTSGNNLLLNFTGVGGGGGGSAGTVYWDVNGATSGSGGPTPNGLWSTNSSNWSVDSTGASATAVWSNGADAVFSAGNDATGAYTITVTNGGVTANSVTVKNGTATITGDSLTLSGSASVTISNGQSATISSVIAGTAGLNANGPGTLTLSGANVYSGATTITNGTVVAGADFVITNTSALVIANNGTFTNNFQQAVGSIAGKGSIILGAAGALSNGFDNTATTFSGVISGAGLLVKYGTGTLTLGGTNTYSGGTAISNGTVYVSADNNLGASGSALTFGGGALETTNNFTLSNRAVTLNSAGGTFNIDRLSTLTANNAIGGTGLLTKSGAGTLVLGGANNYSGGTAISNGTVYVSADNNLGASGGALAFGGGTLEATNNFTLNNRSVALNSGGGTFSVDQLSTLVVTNVISGAGQMFVTGAGILVLTNAVANTYSGGTVISNSTLFINADNNLGTSNVTFNGVGSTLEMTNTFTLTRRLLIQPNTGTGTVNVVGSSTVTATGTIDGGGGGAELLQKSGSGTLVIANPSGQDNNNLNLSVLTGTVVLAAVNSGSGHAASIVQNVSNGATLQIAGSGGDQIYDGASANVFGVFNMNGVLAFNTGTEGFDMLTGTGVVTNMTSNLATLTLGTQNGSSTFAGSIVDGSGSGLMGLVHTGSGVLTLTGTNTFTGGTTINSGGAIQIGNGATSGSIMGAITDNGALLFNRSDVSTNTSAISGSGSVTVLGTGGTTWLLGASSYSGGTTISSNGTVAITADNALGFSGGAVTFSSSSGTLLVTNSFTTGRRFYTSTAGTSTVSVVGNSTVTATGEIDANGAGTSLLTKSGGGTLVMDSSADNNSLNLVVLNGTVVLADSSSGSLHPVSTVVGVSNGATLQLAGTGGDQIYDGFNASNYGVFNMNGVLAFNAGTEGFDMLTGTGVVLNATSSLATLTLGTINGSGTFGGSIQDGTAGGEMALIHTGTGVLTLTGTNTFSGGATINSGAIVLASSVAITNSTITVSANNGLIFSNATAFTIGGLSGASGFNLANTANSAITLSVGNNSSNTTYSGVLAGSGSLVKVGSGKLVVAGNNTYTGSTTISNGELVVANASAVSNSIVSVNVNGGLAFSNGTAFAVGGLSGNSNFGLTNTAGQAVTLSAGNKNGTDIYGGVMSGSGGLTKVGQGTLTLTNSNTYTGPTVINNSGAAGVFALVLSNANGAAIQGNIQVGNVSSGSSGWAWIRTLAPNQFGTNTVLSYNASVNNFGFVELKGNNQALAGLSDTDADGVIENSDDASTAGAVTLTISNNADYSFNGYMRNSNSGSGGAFGLVKDGSGKETLSGGQILYTGGTTVKNGTLDISGATAFSTSGSVSVQGGSLFIGSLNQTVGAFQITGGSLDGSGQLTSSTTYDLQAGSVNARLAGSVGAVKTTAGTVILNGANTYSGVTSNNSGTLLVNGSLAAASSVFVNSTATLGGTGVINGAVTIASGGSLSANAGGTLTLNSSLVNSGIVTANNGGLVVSGNFTNIGGLVFVASAGTFNSATVRNLGSMQLNAGTFNAHNAVVTNTTTGVISLTGGTIIDKDMINQGLIVSHGGLISNALVNTAGAFIDVASGVLTGTPDLVNLGVVTNTATFQIGSVGSGTVTNAGGLVMNGGTFVSGTITNTGSLVGFGVVTAPSVRNSGTIFANNASPLQLGGTVINQAGGVVTANLGQISISGVFSNAGTFAAIGSVGTFGTVVNSGAWISDPTTLVFTNTFTVTTNGYVSMGSGDVYVFSNGATTAGSFVNLSSKSNQFDTSNGKFVFNNTLGLTQTLAVAGVNLGPGAPNPPPYDATNEVQVGKDLYIPGFSNNFALGTLQISDFTTVQVTDAFSGLPGYGTNDGLVAGLYLNNLEMGVDSLLIISSNVQVYFISSNNWDSSNFLLEGNPTFDNSINGLHQLAVVPEPGVIFLWLSGVATFVAARRRGRIRR